HFPPQRGGNVIRRAFALVPVVEHDEGLRAIDLTDSATTAATAARHANVVALDITVHRLLLDDVLELARVAIHVRHGGALRPLQNDTHRSAIVIRRALALERRQEPDGSDKCDGSYDHDRPAVRER